MTFKLFNRLLSFHFRNGCGIDLEFHDGKAIWISKDGLTIEAAMFVGTTISLPFFDIAYGKCYEPETELEIDT